MKNKKQKANFYLAPSKISGVGVFSRIKFKEGDNFNNLITDDGVLIKKLEDKELMKKFCIKKKDGWLCPSDFSRPSFWWYMNHSKNPNLECKNNNFIVSKKIKPGDEITINYQHLDENQNNINVKFSRTEPKNFYQ